MLFCLIITYYYPRIDGIFVITVDSSDYVHTYRPMLVRVLLNPTLQVTRARPMTGKSPILAQATVTVNLLPLPLGTSAS